MGCCARASGLLTGGCAFTTQLIPDLLDKLSAICHTLCSENLMTPEEQMALDAHVHELNDKHSALKKQIESEMARASTDSLQLSRLKREKLRIKDEIEKFKLAGHVA